jgi:hypothetical protein
MTTYPFTGNETKAISFTPTLDGTVYSADVTWNIASQRWYVTITASDGTRIMTRPLIDSPLDRDINLLYGVFTSTMVWRETNGIIEVS